MYIPKHYMILFVLFTLMSNISCNPENEMSENDDMFASNQISHTRPISSSSGDPAVHLSYLHVRMINKAYSVGANRRATG